MALELVRRKRTRCQVPRKICNSFERNGSLLQDSRWRARIRGLDALGLDGLQGGQLARTNMRDRYGYLGIVFAQHVRCSDHRIDQLVTELDHGRARIEHREATDDSVDTGEPQRRERQVTGEELYRLGCREGVWSGPRPATAMRAHHHVLVDGHGACLASDRHRIEPSTLASLLTDSGSRPL